MFIVFKTEKAAKGFIKAKRQKRILQKSEPVSYPTENGLHFYTLGVPEKADDFFLAAAAEKCGKYVTKILAPPDLPLPDNSRVSRFRPVYSNGLFIFNTAIEALEKAKLSPDKICITVIDRNARINGMIHRLLPFASSVRAITSYPEKYREKCNRIYLNCGASVAVRTDYQPSSKSEIIICCNGITTAEMSGAAVFSFRHNSHGRLRFVSDEITLSEAHRKIIPDNIDSVHFAAAVTELCSGTEYKFSSFFRTTTGCSECRQAAAWECLQCFLQLKQ